MVHLRNLSDASSTSLYVEPNNLAIIKFQGVTPSLIELTNRQTDGELYQKTCSAPRTYTVNHFFSAYILHIVA